MYRLLFVIIFILSLISCKKDNDIDGIYTFLAKIAAFDLNCNICVLEFPDDSLIVKKLVGEVPYNNLYNATNLNKDDFIIGQNLEVTFRKAINQEMKGCITLYPSYSNQNIFIVKYKIM